MIITNDKFQFVC